LRYSEAVMALHRENDLVATEHRDGELVSFTAGNLVTYVADFFDVPDATLGRFDRIYDRAAMVALDAPTRARYAQRLLRLLQPGGSMLLVTVEYDPSQMEGPPYSVDEAEVERAFAGTLRVEKVADDDALAPRFSERGVRWMREKTFLLQAKRPLIGS
jgi:thiopurine S-methyltransferase